MSALGRWWQRLPRDTRDSYFLLGVIAAVIAPHADHLPLWSSALTALMLLWRGFKYPPQGKPAKVVAPLGLIGGFLDAAGGGGWGPVVTSNLLIQGADPRRVVGTVNAVEFFLTLTISAAFIYHLGFADVAGATLGLLIGGVAAAPLGAWAAKHIPAKPMLVMVGVVLTATSAFGVWKAWG